MLNDDEIRQAIALHLKVCQEVRDSQEAAGSLGVLRGLRWALVGERRPSVSSMAEVCRAAGVFAHRYLTRTRQNARHSCAAGYDRIDSGDPVQPAGKLQASPRPQTSIKNRSPGSHLGDRPQFNP
jgi:hypothetical protein